MDVLRKELNDFYASQNLRAEQLDYSRREVWRKLVEESVAMDNDCRVITDASADVSYVAMGGFGCVIGLTDEQTIPVSCEVDSSDEDAIYSRIHPEDLVAKRMLEYEFFRFVDTLPVEDKKRFKAACRFRIRGASGSYIYACNTTQVVETSPGGGVWLIMCRYDFAADQSLASDIGAKIINSITGDVMELDFRKARQNLLSPREKEILCMVRDGLPSKLIADSLGISLHTVNRHRQNILEKLSVANSLEAVAAAVSMKLL